ncbi:Hypothetical protein HVR_LOCUS1372 [uncultured virus]|nr:Hypothetical protein HVR_LOCUS1372 [uncultured virus]
MDCTNTKVYSGSEFNALNFGVCFAYPINYLSKRYVPSYGLNQPPVMVDFYKERDITEKIEFSDIVEITIPDDARVEVTDGKFKTDKLFSKLGFTRNAFFARKFVTNRNFPFTRFSGAEMPH